MDHFVDITLERLLKHKANRYIKVFGFLFGTIITLLRLF